MWQVDGGFDLWHESEHQIYSAKMFLQNISPICGDKIEAVVIISTALVWLGRIDVWDGRTGFRA